MSLSPDYQVYDMKFPVEQINLFLENKTRKKQIKRFEERGLIVEIWKHNLGDNALVRIFHPSRSLNPAELELVGRFFSIHGGYACGTGFLDETGEVSQAKAKLCYKTASN